MKPGTVRASSVLGDHRDGRIRTGDPLLPKQVRYQAAPRPVQLRVEGEAAFAPGPGRW